MIANAIEAGKTKVTAEEMAAPEPPSPRQPQPEPEARPAVAEVAPSSRAGARGGPGGDASGEEAQ